MRLPRTPLAVVFSMLLPAAAVPAESPSDLMARGKVAADLGRHAEATTAFQTLADAADAPPSLRVEALIRLGSVRRAAGDHQGSVRAFDRASKHPALDRDTKALLVHALGGAVPDPERWDKIWPRVTFVVDRSNPKEPGLAIRWPDAPAQASARRYTGEPVSLDLKDGDIVDVMRLFADMGGVNVFVDPAVRGRVTLKVHEMPWDEALDLLLRTNGYRWQREGHVVLVHRGDKRLAPKKAYAGEPISLDLKYGDFGDILQLIGRVSGQNVASFTPGGDKVSLKVKEMPWDEVLENILTVHGLRSRREGNVLWVSYDDYMPPARQYSGKAIDVELDGIVSPVEAFDRVAQLAGIELVVDRNRALRSGRLHLKLKQVPWDHALDLLGRMTLHEVVADGARVAVRPLGWTSTTRRPGFQGFRVSEVKVIGVVSHKGSYVAVVEGPDSKAYSPRVGQTLHDGTIVAIDTDNVTFEETQGDGSTRRVTKTIQGANTTRGQPSSPVPPAASVPGATASGSTPAKPGDIVAVDANGVVYPQIANSVRVTMPPRAAAAKIQGVVLVRVLVDEKGTPAKMELVKKIEHPLGQDCNTAALDAVRQMRWTPATKNGVPTAISIVTRIDFRAREATVGPQEDAAPVHP